MKSASWPLGLVLVLVLAGVAVGAEPMAGTVAGSGMMPIAPEDFLTALAQSPRVAAARARLSAARRGGEAAGVLPDPKIGVDIGRASPRSGSASPMYGAFLEQPLPRWGERDAARLNATAATRMGEADLSETIGEEAARVASALSEAQAWRATIILRHEAELRIQVLKDIVHGQLASGAAPVGAAVALDTRAQELALQISDAERQVADADAEVRGRLGMASTDPLPSVAYPQLNGIDVAVTPLGLRATAAQAAAAAEERGAEARGNPETSVGVGWERERAGMPDQDDRVRLSFTMSLPLYRAAYEASADAARARARAATHEVNGSRWMTRSQIERATRAQVQAERARKVAGALAERTRTEMDAITQQVGIPQQMASGSLVQVMDLLDRITAAQQQMIDAELTNALAMADLWRLAPPILPDVRSTSVAPPPALSASTIDRP